MARFDRNPRAHPYEPARVFEEGSEEQFAKTNKYKRHCVLSYHEWLLEILSSIGALVCLGGIVGIFIYMDNKALSEWPWRPSLNATISILTSACIAAFMHSVGEFIGQYKWLYFKKKPRKLADLEKFDDASRGAWGSLKLIFSTSPNLATIGAVITLLRLVFPAFTQQVVFIGQRDISTNSSSASFGYAHSYNHLDKYSTPSGLANAAVEAYPQDPGLQSAIIQGLYGVTPIEPFSCPGACSWNGSYISLGFKTECKDVTQATLKTAKCEGPEYRYKCNMTTPGEIVLTSNATLTESATSYYMNVSAPASKSSVSGELANLPEIRRFAIYRSTPDYNYRIHDINITDCSLFLTAYEYSGARANGSKISFANRREVDFGVANPWEASGDVLGSIHTNASTIDGVHIPALEINYVTFMSLRNFFMSTTIVSEWIEGSYKNKYLGVSAPLSGNVDLNKRFEQMATAMTDYLRYGTNGLSAHGAVIRTEAYVSIRWWWFILPAVTEALVILFTVVTIFRNRKSRGVPLWKSSALAVLTCDLQQHDEQYGLLLSAGKSVDQVKDGAKDIKVVLP